MGDTGRELLNVIAERLLADLDDLVDRMKLGETDLVPTLVADRAIEQEMTASNRANVERVAREILRTPPDRPVVLPTEPPPAAIDVVRSVVRRGLDVDVVLQAYLRGQAVVWGRALDIAGEVAAAGGSPGGSPGSSPAAGGSGGGAAPSGTALVAGIGEFAALLFGYVDGVLVSLLAEAQRLREEMAGGAAPRRAETVRLVLEGAPIEERVASERLGYELSRRHVALLLWQGGEARDAGELEAVAVTLARAAGARPPLTVGAGVRALWAWLSPGTTPDVHVWRTVMDRAPAGVRVAVGRPMAGIAGFRGSHVDAEAVARLVGGDPGGARLVTFAEVEAILPMSQDERAAARFVRDTLGGLAADDERGARLRRTLRVYLEQADGASAAAEILHTHRNTVLQRIAAATELLGHPPGERRLAVMTALDLAHYVGRAVLTG